MKDFLKEQLNIQGIKFKRVDRSGNRNDSSPWQVIEMTEHMLWKATFLKGAGFFINEDFSKETQAIKKKTWIKENNWEIQVSVHAYNKVLWRERKKTSR